MPISSLCLFPDDGRNPDAEHRYRVQVCAITGGPLDLGLIGLVQFLPFVVLVLPPDSFNRRTIVALCYTVDVVCTLLLL